MKTSLPSEVIDLYDGHASNYSKMMDSEIDLPMYADILSRLATRLRGHEGPVIDTACGPGHMLARYIERYDTDRAVIGVDLSPQMVGLARERLGGDVSIYEGDMTKLSQFEPNSAAAIINFFALQHLSSDVIPQALFRWADVLKTGGQLILATWEGEGSVDYGDAFDIVAARYTKEQIEGWTTAAGFTIDRCEVKDVEGFPMKAIYLEATAT